MRADPERGQDSTYTSLEGSRAFYRRQARLYDLTRWMSLRGRQRFFDALAVEPGYRVLEVGCGTGLNFAHIMRRIGRTGSMTALDLSPDMLARAERRIQRKGWSKAIKLVDGNAESFELGEKFDAVFFAYSISMIPDWVSSLESALRHLKPNGRLGVLDFGLFESWLLPIPWIVKKMFTTHHVDPTRNYVNGLRKLCDPVQVECHLGNWYFFAVGVAKVGSI